MQWWEIAERQCGVITRPQLVAGGRGEDAVDDAHRRNELTRLCRSVYLVGGAPYTFRARLWAAVLATDGLLCRQTSGRLWGVHDEDDREVHVHVPHTRRISIPAGVRLHRCAAWGSVRERSGLPVVGRGATVVDLLGCLPAGSASRLADRALQRGWIAPDDIARRLADQPRRPGNPQLRRLLAQLGDGAAAQSERVLHRLLGRAGITGWRANHEVWSNGELIGVVDVAMLDRGLAIEVDGMAFHTDVDRFRGDRRRQNALVGLGWTVLRFTWADLTERPGYVIATLQRMAA